jgi:hypothetical protein
MAKKNNYIQFEATLSPIQSAIKIDGQEGARVTFDIPDTEIACAAKLILMRGKNLKVSVEEYE